MSDNKNVNQDKGLQGNEKIEQAIAALQQEATQEMLAHTLTVIRRRMREKGQFILSVEPPHRRQPTSDRHSENRRWKSLVGGIYRL